MNDILERLEQARLKAELSQAAVGKELGVAANTYSRLERGETPLTVQRLLIVCAILKVSPIWVLIGAEPDFHANAVMEALLEAERLIQAALSEMRI